MRTVGYYQRWDRVVLLERRRRRRRRKRTGFERRAHRVLVVSIEKRKGPVSGKCEENTHGAKSSKQINKKKKRHNIFFVISFIVVITLILLDSLCLSRLSLSLSLLIMCCFLSLRAQSFNLRLEVRLLLFVRQLRQLELLTGVSRLRSRLLRKTRVFANRVVDFLV